MATDGKQTDRTKIRDEDPKIRSCCNCLHFNVVEEGYEIGRIEDTRFMTSSCDVFGWNDFF